VSIYTKKTCRNTVHDAGAHKAYNVDKHKECVLITSGNMNEVEGNECGDAKEYRKRATEAKETCVSTDTEAKQVRVSNTRGKRKVVDTQG